MKRIPVRQTIMAAAGFAVLCGLGTWQLYRLQWKNGIIERLESDYAQMETQGTPLTAPARLDVLSAEENPIAIAKLRGHLLRDKSLLLGPRTLEGRAGYHLLVPMALPGNKTLIVNAGWVDSLWQDHWQDRLADLPSGRVTVTGVLRKPDWSRFASRNSPANNLWFRADIDEIAQHKQLTSPYPFMLYASHAEPPLKDIVPVEGRWLPRNKHLQYALFWFAMAAALISVFGLYLKSRR